MVCIISVCSTHTWEGFKQKHGKAYKSKAEESRRQAIWQRNHTKIMQHNKEADQNVHSHNLAVNQFADLNEKEFVAKFSLKLMPLPQTTTITTKTTTTAQPKSTTTSQSKVTSVGKDWRKLGGVTPVKDQEVRECSSCWAHAVVGSIESQYLI